MFFFFNEAHLGLLSRFNQICHGLRVIIILEFWFDVADLVLLLLFSQMYHGKKISIILELIV